MWFTVKLDILNNTAAIMGQFFFLNENKSSGLLELESCECKATPVNVFQNKLAVNGIS